MLGEGEGRGGRLRQISELPYDRRRMIVVRDAGTPDPTSAGQRIGNAFRSGGILGIAVTMAAVEAVRILGERSAADWAPLAVTTSEAADLQFPVGHPRRAVVYVGHPIDPMTYIPMAQFHTFLFEHKVAEALRLIRSLGADTVDVVHVQGWDSRVGIKLSAPLPGAEQVQASAAVGVERGRGHSIIGRMRLQPSGPPRIPNNLVWFPHEPLWKEVADARLTSGLRAFVLDIKSFDDYGVNANLQALIARSGLEAGGSFVEHSATWWRLEGTFLD